MIPYNPYRCPLCAGHTVRRHGVHFEHERRCGECKHCYDPEEELQKWRGSKDGLAYEREQLALQAAFARA